MTTLGFLFLGLIALCLIGLIVWQEWLQRKERLDWDRERRLLITRIQTPEMAPLLAEVPVRDDEETGPPTEAEEYDLIVKGDSLNGDAP